MQTGNQLDCHPFYPGQEDRNPGIGIIGNHQNGAVSVKINQEFLLCKYPDEGPFFMQK
jgi:hypothetical protein